MNHFSIQLSFNSIHYQESGLSKYIPFSQSKAIRLTEFCSLRVLDALLLLQAQ
jgi:hypothetical protein